MINLMPWRERLLNKKKKAFILYIILTFLLGFCLSYFIYSLDKNKLNERYRYNQKIKEKLIRLNIRENNFKKEITTKSNELEIINKIKKLYKNQLIPIAILNVIPQILPNDIYLTKLIKNNKSITIFGKSKKQLAITKLVKLMQASSLFNNVRLERINYDKKEINNKSYQFEINGNLTN
jgi:type IV pilus assembly protein PilN